MDHATTSSFEVSSYLQHESVSGDMVLHTSNGIVLVRDGRMKAFLRDVEAKAISQASMEHLKDYFGNETDEAIQFLQTYTVLREQRTLNFEVTSIRFITNCTEVGIRVDHVMKVMTNSWSCRITDDTAEITSYVQSLAGSPTFLVVFLNPYSRHIAHSIRTTLLRAPNTYLLMAYTYNNCLYIDSLFQSKWKVPCHICQIRHIESDLRNRFAGAVTYQRIVDQLLGDDATTEVHTPLTPRWTLNIATQLVNRMDRLVTVGHSDTIQPEEYRYGYMLDLNTMHTLQDVTTFWELCDCYE